MSTNLSNYDINIYRGNTFKLDFKYTDNLNRGIDLSGYTARMQVRRSRYDDKLVAELNENYPNGSFGRGIEEDFSAGNGVLGYTGGIILNYEGVTGQIHIEIDTETTWSMPVGKHAYGLELIENSTGIQRTILRGTFQLLSNTTRYPRSAPEFIGEPGLTVEYGDIDPGGGENGDGDGSTDGGGEDDIFSGSNAWGTDILNGNPQSSIEQGKYLYINQNVQGAEGIDYQYYIDYSVDQGELIYFKDLVYEISHSNYYASDDVPVPPGGSTFQTDTYIWRVGSTVPIESGVFLDGTPWVVDNGDLYLVDCTPKEQLIETSEGYGIVGRTVINPDFGKMKVDMEWTGVTFPKQVLSDVRTHVKCSSELPVYSRKSQNIYAQPLIPGTGFISETETPDIIGDGTGAFSDKVPIARWNVIPWQEYEDFINIGVIAFHGNGIEKVEFIADGGFKTVVERMSINPSTGNSEYWCTLNTKPQDSTTTDRLVEVRAIIYPKKGQPLVLQGSIEPGLDSAYTGIHSLFMISNFNKTLPVIKKYVDSENGSDDYPYGSGGANNQPYKTIARAALELGPILAADAPLTDIYRHCEINIMNAGEHVMWYYPAGNGSLPSDQPSTGNIVRNNEWITVQPDPAGSLTKDDIILISMGEDSPTINQWSHPEYPRRKIVRDNIRKIKYKNVTFDLSTIREIYSNGFVWFDDCLLKDDSGVLQYPQGTILKSDGTTSPSEGSPYWLRSESTSYATNSTIENTLLGWVGFNIVRNCFADTIYADVFVNSLLVVDSDSKNVAGTILTYHADTHQYFKGGNEIPKTNVIVFGVRHIDPAFMQGFFLDHASNEPVPMEHKNFAFVDIAFDYWRSSTGTDGGEGDEATQLNRSHENVIFAHVSLPWQRVTFREDSSKTFSANDVLFDSCIFKYFGREIISGGSPDTEHGIPPGVILRNVHVRETRDMLLPGGEPNGIIENLTVGGVTLEYIESEDSWNYIWETGEQTSEHFGNFIDENEITRGAVLFNSGRVESTDPLRRSISTQINPFDFRSGIANTNSPSVRFLTRNSYDETQGWDYQATRIESGDMIITQTPYTNDLTSINTDNAPLGEFPFTESWGCFSVISEIQDENSFRPPINWDPRDKQNRPIFTEQETFNDKLVSYPNYTISSDDPVDWGTQTIAYSDDIMNRLGTIYLAMQANRYQRGSLKAQYNTTREYGGIQAKVEERMMLSCFDPNVDENTRTILRRVVTQRAIDGYGAVRSLGKNIEGYGGGHHMEYAPRMYFAWAVTNSSDIFDILDLTVGNTGNSTLVVYDKNISNDGFGEEHIFDEMVQSQFNNYICSFRHFDLNVVEVNTEQNYIKVERPIGISVYKENNIGNPPLHLCTSRYSSPAGSSWSWSSNERIVNDQIKGSYVRTKINGSVNNINRIIKIEIENGDGNPENPQFVKFYLQESSLDGNETTVDLSPYLEETKNTFENVTITYGFENTGGELGLNPYSYAVIAHTLSNHLIGKAKGGKDFLPYYGKVAWDKSLNRATSMNGKEMIFNPKNVNTVYNISSDLYYSLIRQEIGNGILLDQCPTEKGGTDNPENWYPLPTTRTWDEIEYPPYEIIYWSTGPGGYNSSYIPVYNWTDNSFAFTILRFHSFYNIDNGWTFQMISRTADCPKCLEWQNIKNLTPYIWPSGDTRPIELERYYLQEGTEDTSTSWTANWKIKDVNRKRVHGWNRGLVCIFFVNKDIASINYSPPTNLQTEEFKPNLGSNPIIGI